MLKTSIKLFGLIDGFKFWFEWNIKWPVQKFVWLNISHRPYCTHHGYGCKSLSGKKCEYPKLIKKEDILKHWERDKEESKKIIEGKNGKCVYCDVFPGRVLIPDPNGSLAKWKVCVTCKKIIATQQRLSFAVIMLERETDNKLKDFWKKEIKKAQEKIDFLSAESFIPAVTIVIRKRTEN